MHGKNSKDTASQEFDQIIQRDFLPSIKEGEDKNKTSFNTRHRSVAPSISKQEGLNNHAG
jgi:hypothetical protein